MKGPEIRKSTYAGVLYPKSAQDLEKMIQTLLGSARVELPSGEEVKALIVPYSQLVTFSHGGYYDISSTSSYGFKSIKNMYKVKRVYIIGPSKLNTLVGCALSSSLSYKCPLGNLNICFEGICYLTQQSES